MAAADAKLAPWFDGSQCTNRLHRRMEPAAPQQPRTAESGVVSACGHFPFALAVPGGALGRVRATPGALPAAGRRGRSVPTVAWTVYRGSEGVKND